MAIKQTRYRVAKEWSTVSRISECVIMERTLAFPGFSSINRLECLRRARSPGQSYLPSGFGRALCANDHHDMDRGQDTLLSSPPMTPQPPAAFIISGWLCSCSQASPRITQPEAPSRTRGTQHSLVSAEQLPDLGSSHPALHGNSLNQDARSLRQPASSHACRQKAFITMLYPAMCASLSSPPTTPTESGACS